MARRNYAPDYCDRDTLAYRLSIAPGAVDQYVKRRVLPPPVKVGDAKLWRWADVDNWLAGGGQSMQPAAADPYLMGIEGVKSASAARKAS